GRVHYQGYNALTGQMTYSVRDVYPGASQGAIVPAAIVTPDQDGGVDIWVAWSGAAPKGSGGTFNYDFQTTPTSPVEQETKRLMDLQGRLKRSTAPDGVLTYITYLDGEMRSYAAWNSSTHKPRLPARRIKSDKDGRTTEVIEVDPTSITISDPPDGSE